MIPWILGICAIVVIVLLNILGAWLDRKNVEYTKKLQEIEARQRSKNNAQR